MKTFKSSSKFNLKSVKKDAVKSLKKVEWK